MLASFDNSDFGRNDKDPYTVLLTPGIMMDTGADEACSDLPNNSPQSPIQFTGGHASQNCYPITFRPSGSN